MVHAIQHEICTIPNPSRILFQFQIDLASRRTMAVAALRNLVTKIRIPGASALRASRPQDMVPLPPPPEVWPVRLPRCA